MQEYTLSLALVDFLPVIFTAVGLFYIARMVAHISPEQGRAVYLGAVLTVAGGASKALWKLLMAGSGGSVDIAFLEASLFVLMAPGYVLIAWSVWQAVRKVSGRKARSPWIVPAAIIAVTFAASIYLGISRPDSPAWERVLLSVMVLATLFTGVLLIIFALREKLTLAGVLFIVNLVGVFLLNGLARMSNQTIALQWVEEAINALAWLAFAVAARLLYDHARARFGVDAPALPATDRAALELGESA